MAQLQFKLDSKIGPLYVVTSEKGLRGVFWTKQKVPMSLVLDGSLPEVKNMTKAINEISEYLEGKRKKFDLLLDIEGTEFQNKVWTELLKIPYGKTRSYKEVAQRIGTNGIRAVGTANGKNSLCIVVPCHRVIATGGGLGGYSGGLDIKKRLLDLEQGNNL
ncbi:MAG: methylated-DNA--[protein]-cysteine S-methyltransferase [Bdellovibrionaceae bacterium]|nr:methylated-DNA--[protein]-cysteine S-methyltransferase [Pseudobdellovibrionaceae bacterium]